MKQEIEVVDESHPFRFIIKFAAVAGLLYAAGRFLAQKKNEYAGLTESEARSKFVEKVGPRLGDETAEDIADQVIPRLKERGLVMSDPVDTSSDQVEEAAEKIDDAADAVSDAVDSVVKD